MYLIKNYRMRAFSNACKLLKAGIVDDEKTINRYVNRPELFNKLIVEHRGASHKGCIVYEIHEAGRGHGFFAEYRTLLMNLVIAEDYGFIPSVKYSNEYAYYDSEKAIEEKNPFEYYFEPIGSDIDIQRAQNVIVSSLDYVHCKEYMESFDGSHFSEKLFWDLVEAEKKYIRIRHDLVDQFENDMNRIFRKDIISAIDVLGVHYRGTDYSVGYNGHPKQVDIEDSILEIRKALKIGGFKAVFVATDDREALDVIKDSLKGIRVLYNDKVYRAIGKESVAFSDCERPMHHYELGVEVLEDAFLLSKFGGLIGSLSQVSWGARFLKAGRDECYDYLQIVDKGINKNSNRFR